jgi:hypothetical protein
VLAGIVVTGAITLLALTVRAALLATTGPFLAWLGLTATLTVSTVLFAVLVPPAVLAQRRWLVLALVGVQVVVVAVGGLLLRHRLGLGTPSSDSTMIWLLAVAASYSATKALARAGVTDRLRRLRLS